MSLLKGILDSQEPSHGNASMFLHTLKTLMAKLKASDWSALDREIGFIRVEMAMLTRAEPENLAAYRAQTLQALLFNAMVFGVAENDASDGQLKV